MNIGDLVVRKSYGGDVTFRVEGLQLDAAVIKGTEFRLIADSPVDDLIQVPYEPQSAKTRQAHIKAHQTLSRLQQNRMEQAERNREGLVQDWSAQQELTYFEMPGKVLHLDGDPNYLKKVWISMSNFVYPQRDSMSMNRQWQIPYTAYYPKYVRIS